MASDYQTMFTINNTFVHCKQCLWFRNLNSIKPFINIFNIEFYGFLYFITIFHTSIYSGCNSDTVFNITYVGSADWSLFYIINY